MDLQKLLTSILVILVIKIKEHSFTERSFVFRDINGSELEKK